jgi:hypothetical protein
MTARARLNQRMRWIRGAMYAGGGLFLIGLLIGAIPGQQPVLAVSLPGFAVAFVFSMAAYFVCFRCQRCRGNLGPLLMQRGLLSVDPQVCFCPYCGGGLDQEMLMETRTEST